MIRQRDFWMFVLLNICTCGIYGLFFWYSWNEDVNMICDGDGEYAPNFIVVLLLSFVTCSIYWYYWMYKQGNRLQRNSLRYGIQIQENGSTFLLWGLLGYLTCSVATYYGYYLMIQAVNKAGYGWNQQGYTYRNQNQETDSFESREERMPDQGQILCLAGPEPHRVTEIADAQTLTLGQDGGVCNHIIMGYAIEAKHCSITYRKWDDTYMVTDHSEGGTYKASDDTRLPKERMVELAAGTVICLGDRRTMYRLG